MDTSLIRVEDYQDENDIYARSNVMIRSQYRQTLFGNRLMAMSLSRISTAEESEEGFLTVHIKGGDIKTAMNNTKNGAFFKQLSQAAHNLTGQSIGFTDQENDRFTYIAAVISAEYANGVFSITFHNRLKQYLTDLSQSYTLYSLKIMMNWQSNATFRFFELVKSRMYHRKNDLINANSNLYRIEFDINELKLCLGVVNSDLASVKKILDNSKGTPEDWARAVEASPEKLYSTWYDFKRKIIDRAVNEINGCPECGIKINGVDTKKSGKGGKVHAVVIYAEKLLKRTIKKAVTEIPELDYDDLIEQIQEIIGHIRIKEARSIGDAAKWDIEKITRNYEYSKGCDVEDIVGFMIKAVKEDWASSPKKPRKRGNTGQKNSGFANFKERDYDFKELESII